MSVLGPAGIHAPSPEVVTSLHTGMHLDLGPGRAGGQPPGAPVTSTPEDLDRRCPPVHPVSASTPVSLAPCSRGDAGLMASAAEGTGTDGVLT